MKEKKIIVSLTEEEIKTISITIKAEVKELKRDIENLNNIDEKGSQKTINLIVERIEELSAILFKLRSAYGRDIVIPTLERLNPDSHFDEIKAVLNDEIEKAGAEIDKEMYNDFLAQIIVQFVNKKGDYN